MASPQQTGPGDEWRLGIELAEPHERPPGTPGEGREPDLSDARLNRPLQVVTVEHLGWFAVVAWTLITRLIALGARPLSASEAGHALFEYDLAFATREAGSAGYHPGWSGWVHLAQAAVFAAAGANDVTARLIFMLAGLLIVAMAFEMRHYVGRAGALSLAALLATSPSLTYFSRANEPVVVALAMAMVVIAIFMALVHEPGIRRALGLGCAGGLMLAADPTALVILAAFLAALAIMGLWELAVGRDAYLRSRVWMDRYSRMLVTVIVTCAVVWVLSQLALPGGLQNAGIRRSLQALWGASRSDYRGSLQFYIPPLTLYEFPTVLAFAAGIIAIIAWRVRSHFAVFCMLWTLASAAYYLLDPVRQSAWVLQMILPAAFVGAFFIDYFHHSHVWQFARYPLAALLALGLYAQLLSNFVYPGPDASEAHWAQHGNLYWRSGATTFQTRERIADALKMVAPAEATVFLNGEWPPALRWYLRGLRPAANPDSAAVSVDLAPAGENNLEADRYEFDYEQSWNPQLGAADAAVLLRFWLTARLWGEVDTRTVSMTVRRSGNSAPTVILAPGASE